MKRSLWVLFAILMVPLFSGCSTALYRRSSHGGSRMDGPWMASIIETERVEQSQKLIWRARLTLEVNNIQQAVSRVKSIVAESNGYIETQRDSGDDNASLTVRIPAETLSPTLKALEGLGWITSRTVSSEDVTESYVDLDSRLKNLVSLRDRLRELLEKAEKVEDILSIEKELSRVQSDIDSMQARFNALKGRIDYTSITVTLNRKRVLGPLGYVFKGVWWTVEKMFVLRK